jgi:hypothetical protein
MRSIVAGGLCAAALFAVPAAAYATPCSLMKLNCVDQGGSNAACQQAWAVCKKTCIFTGPVTGRVWHASGDCREAHGSNR